MWGMIKKVVSVLLVACYAFSIGACQEGNALNDSAHNSIDNINSSIQSVICTEHSFKSQIIEKATCTKNGAQIYTCENCGVYYREDISALGHEFNTSEVSKEPTKTSDGVRKYTCARGCGYSYTEDIPMLAPTILISMHLDVTDENGERGTLWFENYYIDYLNGYINYSEYNHLIFVSYDWSSVHLYIRFDDNVNTFHTNTYRLKFVLQLYKVDPLDAFMGKHDGGVFVCEQEYSLKYEVLGGECREVIFEFNEPLEDDVCYEIRFAKAEIIALE